MLGQSWHGKKHQIVGCLALLSPAAVLPAEGTGDAPAVMWLQAQLLSCQQQKVGAAGLRSVAGLASLQSTMGHIEQQQALQSPLHVIMQLFGGRTWKSHAGMGH